VLLKEEEGLEDSSEAYHLSSSWELSWTLLLYRDRWGLAGQRGMD